MKEIGYYFKNRLLDTLCYLTKPWRNFDPEKNLLVFSSPRSGSTWVSEMINLLPGTAILWELLHQRNVDQFAKLGFAWR